MSFFSCFNIGHHWRVHPSAEKACTPTKSYSWTINNLMKICQISISNCDVSTLLIRKDLGALWHIGCSTASTDDRFCCHKIHIIINLSQKQNADIDHVLYQQIFTYVYRQMTTIRFVNSWFCSCCFLIKNII